MSTGLNTPLDQLDRKHSLTDFYRKVDAAEKQKARLAFIAYESAVASGDAALAAVTRERFLQATAVLAKARKAER